MNMNCEICEIEPAELIKHEAREVPDEDGDLTSVKVALMICKGCAEEHYDGTEEYPGVRKLVSAK